MKTAFLKHESRKIENLIADFSTTFAGYKYFENTQGSQNQGIDSQFGSALEFMQDAQIEHHLLQIKQLKDEYRTLLLEEKKGTTDVNQEAKQLKI